MIWESIHALIRCDFFGEQPGQVGKITLRQILFLQKGEPLPEYKKQGVFCFPCRFKVVNSVLLFSERLIP